VAPARRRCGSHQEPPVDVDAGAAATAFELVDELELLDELEVLDALDEPPPT
jgi:hypothetical protein